MPTNPRTIPCPECKGKGDAWYDADRQCLTCRGTGEREDRRTPTAAERAVERIKACIEAESLLYAAGPWDKGKRAGMDHIMDIIRDEEGR